ncbi:MAG: hypothetical protein GF383_08385 [Candidatus Lokiarchaeota archaeon]|nr:hypothetical protein [Candidatus Lokiarchaeota archaeon]MBD3340371.1 hypothetical protein [Candidatus Lokiarchaeota archaeon]
MPYQIHIIFNCEEEERLTKPIIDNSPDKVYYFKAYIKETGQTDVNVAFYERNVKSLKDQIPELVIKDKIVDYTDYIETIQELSKIIRKERERDSECQIYINVSSGSKITSLAAVEASKLWDCEIYYVYSSYYDPLGPAKNQPMHKGKVIIKTPTTFPIRQPKRQYLRILNLIGEMIEDKYRNKEYNKKKRKYLFKKYVIDKLYDEGLLKLQRKNKDPRKLTSSLYMKGTKYFNHLEKELKFIKISDDKRNKKIFLTKKGQDILDIFKYSGVSNNR